MRLERTGKSMPFLDVQIGNPFWAHNRVWGRTDGDAATELHDTGEHSSCCNFLIDGTVRPKRTYGFPNRDLCEEVEGIKVIP